MENEAALRGANAYAYAEEVSQYAVDPERYFLVSGASGGSEIRLSHDIAGAFEVIHDEDFETVITGRLFMGPSQQCAAIPVRPPGAGWHHVDEAADVRPMAAKAGCRPNLPAAIASRLMLEPRPGSLGSGRFEQRLSQPSR